MPPSTFAKANAPQTIAIIGGGAAGYFAAIHAAQAVPPATKVLILEGTHRPLTKVRISGGGRCNVTHSCFDPAALVQSYPRGSRELRGPFSRFQPQDTVAFFKTRGIDLKTEADGRMFPTTDQSSTIVNCLRESARHAGAEERLGVLVKKIQTTSPGSFQLTTNKGELQADKILLATGSGPQGHKLAKDLGHNLISPTPSLFTFVCPDKAWHELAGVSMPDVNLSLKIASVKKPYVFRGPFLVTHWGFSGPAVLKLSAFAARDLFDTNYQASLTVDWFPVFGNDLTARVAALQAGGVDRPRMLLRNAVPQAMAKRLWQLLIDKLTPAIGLDPATPIDRVRPQQWQALAQAFGAMNLEVAGKGEFKDEFVTAGGVDLKQVDMRTMMSKVVPNLHFAGELLNIDGITGGFNFQNAWTTGYLAGLAMAEEPHL